MIANILISVYTISCIYLYILFILGYVFDKKGYQKIFSDIDETDILLTKIGLWLTPIIPIVNTYILVLLFFTSFNKNK